MSFSFEQHNDRRERVVLPEIMGGVAFVPGSGRNYRLFGNEEEPFSVPEIPELPSICAALKTPEVSLDEALRQIDAFFPQLSEPLPETLTETLTESLTEALTEPRPEGRVTLTLSTDSGSINLARKLQFAPASSVSAENIINEVMQTLPKPKEEVRNAESPRTLRIVCDDEEEPFIIPFVKPEVLPTEPEIQNSVLKIVAEFVPTTISFNVFQKCWQSRRKEKIVYRKQCLPPVFRQHSDCIAQAEEPPPSIDTSSFRWSEQLNSLMQTASNQIRMLTDHLIVQSNQGVKAICFKGVSPGDGCTTLLLCATRALTERGYRVLLVDAHHRHIDLPKQLNLSGNLDSEDEVVAVNNHLSLWVWHESKTVAENRAILATIVSTHREEYDLILLDDGSVTECPLADFVEFWDRVEPDGVVLISNTKREVPVSHITGRLRQHHIHLIGITENYV